MPTVDEFYQRIVESERRPLVLTQDDAFNPNFRQALERFKEEGHTVLICIDNFGEIRHADISELSFDLPGGNRDLLNSILRKPKLKL